MSRSSWGGRVNGTMGDFSLAISADTVDFVRLLVEIFGFSAVVWGLLLNVRSIQTTVALEFMKRFEGLEREFPELIDRSKWDAGKLATPEQKERFLRFFKLYLNLCSEEYSLHENGRISRDIWRVWKSEIVSNLSTPAAKLAWTDLRSAFASHPTFSRFVDKIIEKSKR